MIWSLLSLFIVPEYKNSSFTNNELYLVASKINSAFCTINEDNKKTRYSQENTSRLYYSIKFLVSSSSQIIKLTGNFHFIQSWEIPEIISVFALNDLSRPPPFLS